MSTVRTLTEIDADALEPGDVVLTPQGERTVSGVSGVGTLVSVAWAGPVDRHAGLGPYSLYHADEIVVVAESEPCSHPEGSLERIGSAWYCRACAHELGCVESAEVEARGD